MEIKTYYCDICGVEVPINEIRVIKIKFSQESDYDYEKIEICEKCYIEATKDFNTYEQRNCNKEKLLGIFKVWFKNKTKIKEVAPLCNENYKN